MADPITVIGAIASVIQLIDASAKILGRLNEYRSKGNELPTAFVHVSSQLPILREVLDKSKEAISTGHIGPNEVKAIEPCLLGCRQQMEKLKETLSTILPEAQEKTFKKMTKGLLSIWKESDVRKIDDEIASYVSRLTFYCAWSSSRLDPRNQDMLTPIQQWLAPPDTFSSLRRSLKMRSAGTGKWYLESTHYDNWKVGGASFAWLHGSAGSGKTILSAGIIEDLQGYCNGDPTRSLAFFFFDFNDTEKQEPISMIKSLLIQLLGTCARVPESIQLLHDTCIKSGQRPSEQQLLQALKSSLEILPAPFVVLDALDECNDWHGLFDILEEMQSWSYASLRVLATSREEVEIEEALEDLVLPAGRFCLESHLVDKDIQTYVHKRLMMDRSFRGWQKKWQKNQDEDVLEEIEKTLARKACGMYGWSLILQAKPKLTKTRRFRWAVCQLDDVAECVTRGMVRRALQNLPKNLDETYARILCRIDKSQTAETALKILRWLAYARRPLMAKELLEVTGVFTDKTPRFDEDEVMRDTSDILRVCSSFVSVTVIRTCRIRADDDNNETDDRSLYVYRDIDNDESKDHSVYNNRADDTSEANDQSAHSSQAASESVTEYVRLAHLSVKEYFISNRPCLQRYQLQHKESHDILARHCLVYLLRFMRECLQRPDWSTMFPLADYATLFWTEHARISGAPSQQQRDLSMEFLTRNSAALEAWGRFDGFRLEPWTTTWAGTNGRQASTPLYVASSEGIIHAVREILDDTSTDVDVRYGNNGNALYAASWRGYDEIVEMLLARNADPDDNTLSVAAQAGHLKIVEMLLSKGADASSVSLEVASRAGKEKIVEILLARGADIDNDALHAASCQGYEKIVEMLLAHGADVNRGHYIGSALQGASGGGHEKIVDTLLAHGADVNADEGLGGSALGAASAEGHQRIVEILLAHGADVNAELVFQGSALRQASVRGHQRIVDVLLAHGAKPLKGESTEPTTNCSPILDF